MTQVQILDEFKQLSVKEQLDVLVTAVQILQNKFHQLEQQQTKDYRWPKLLNCYCKTI